MKITINSVYFIHLPQTPDQNPKEHLWDVWGAGDEVNELLITAAVICLLTRICKESY